MMAGSSAQLRILMRLAPISPLRYSDSPRGTMKWANGTTTATERGPAAFGLREAATTPLRNRSMSSSAWAGDRGSRPGESSARSGLRPAAASEA